MNASAPRLLISLHDVTPFHLERIRRAEKLFRELGLGKVAYLFVPEYHGGYPSAEDVSFIEFCRAKRPFRVQWQLHGYRHLEAADPELDGGAYVPSGLPSARETFKRTLLTAGEGEFLALKPAAQKARLLKGLESFRHCLGSDPDAFVPPAWLFNAGLRPILDELDIRHTEDQRRLYRTDSNASLSSPVITWATRTPIRKYGSLVVCPLLARLFSRTRYLRVAMHPFDFDHGSTVRSIRSVLKHVMKGREQAFPNDLDFPG